jgi:hypothetical protein
MMDERVTTELNKIVLADGKEYKVRPLTLLATKELLPAIQKMDEIRTEKGITNELVDLMGDICLAILKPTTPELTKDKVLELVELGSVIQLIALAMTTTK